MKKQPTDENNDAGKPRFGPDERRLVLAVAFKLVRDRDAAEDVAQDAMLIAFRHRASFRGDCQFTTWLYRIAATTALMHLRKRHSQRAELSAADTEPHAGLLMPGLNPEDRLIVKQEIERTGRSLASMGRIYGTIVRMRFAEGYSSGEISMCLGINAATVKSRAHRGRAALRADHLGHL